MTNIYQEPKNIKKQRKQLAELSDEILNGLPYKEISKSKLLMYHFEKNPISIQTQIAQKLQQNYSSKDRFGYVYGFKDLKDKTYDIGSFMYMIKLGRTCNSVQKRIAKWCKDDGTVQGDKNYKQVFSIQSQHHHRLQRLVHLFFAYAQRDRKIVDKKGITKKRKQWFFFCQEVSNKAVTITCNLLMEKIYGIKHKGIDPMKKTYYDVRNDYIQMKEIESQKQLNLKLKEQMSEEKMVQNQEFKSQNKEVVINQQSIQKANSHEEVKQGQYLQKIQQREGISQQQQQQIVLNQPLPKIYLQPYQKNLRDITICISKPLYVKGLHYLAALKLFGKHFISNFSVELSATILKFLQPREYLYAHTQTVIDLKLIQKIISRTPNVERLAMRVLSLAKLSSNKPGNQESNQQKSIRQKSKQESNVVELGKQENPDIGEKADIISMSQVAEFPIR